MGDFRKKISSRLISRGKSLQGYNWEKSYPAVKKISLITLLCVKEKISTLTDLSKKFYPNYLPTHPHTQKSHGQPHSEWGKRRI